MTFDQIVDNVMDTLNYTSDEARERVGTEVNEGYREVTSSIGLETSRQREVSAHSVEGSRTMIFNAEKLLSVIDRSTGRDIVLTQITPAEMRVLPLRSQPPREFSIERMRQSTVEIKVDCIPDSEGFTLYADAIENLGIMSGDMEPQFPASFHDILYYSALSDEYRKMEKVALMQMADKDFEKRLSDLRMFIAKSAYLDQYQGRYAANTFRWTRNGSLVWNQ